MSATQSGKIDIDSEAPGRGTRSRARNRTLAGAEMSISVSMDSGASLPTKRKHESDIDGPSTDVLAKRPKPAEPVKHPHYWFDDGSVVIQIDNTQFKLYRGHLSRHSTFFAELFRGPTKCGVDGLPQYQLSDTSVKDFEALLNLMDDMIDLTTDNSWPDSDVIAPILRASTTLAFPRFRDFCIHMLRRTWSDDLNFYTTYGIPFPAETIVLAKQYHVPDVLKRSYYELIRENLLDEKSGSYATLSSEDLFLVIKTRNELSEEWMSLVAVPASFACPRKNNDSEKSVCPSLASRKAAWYKIVHESGLAQEWASDPIAGLDKLIAADWKAHRFCDECTERRQAEWREKKEELWEKLDEWLQLKEARAEPLP